MLLVCSSAALGQTTYYVASNGSDNNDGRSAGSPFQSIGKVNGLTLQAGDQVLFRRGDTFRGTLQIRQSGSSAQPIVIDAFGSGNKPVLAGSLPVSSWNSVGSNLWQASVPFLGGQVTGVYRNGTTLPLGRYPNLNAPNRGYLTIQSHSGTSQFTSVENVPANFTGGEVVDRPVQWIMNRSVINSQNGNTFYANESGSYNFSDGWGYFIQNHPATLDQTGEWYYNPGNKTLLLYSDSDPNGQTITATAYTESVRINSVSNVTVRNVAVTQAINTNMLIENGTGITISGVDITQAGEDGLTARGSGNTVLVEGSFIDEVNNNGVNISGYQNFTFRNNTLQRVGLVPGRGKTGDGTYIGFNAVSTNNVTVENNVVDQIGYNGINFTEGTTLRRNRVSNFCLTKSDGGGFYIWNGTRQPMNNVHILNNISFNGIGAPEGTPGGNYSGANGFFLDDCTTNVDIRDNTAFNCRGLGFFLHGAITAQFFNNTAYNNGEAQLAVNSRSDGCSPSNNNIQNNILVSRLPSQFVTKFESHLNDLRNYGQFDNNVYARPFDDQFKLRIAYNAGSGVTGADLSLGQWQSQYGKDPNSLNSPITYKPFVVTGSGQLKLNSTFGGNNEGWDVWSPYGNGRVNWDNGNRLDGGSLSIGFPTGSGQANSYLLASKSVGSISQNQVYLLTFDAVASGSAKRVEVFLRQKTGSYNDLDARSVVLVSNTRQHYELSYTGNANEADAIVAMQVTEDGQTLWVDNVQLQPATRTAQNPDDFIRLEYNDTNSDKTVSLGGTYRDGRNKVYANQVTLTPFTSVVLFKDNSATPPPPPPVTILRDPENPANAVVGLDYSYYEGAWSQVSELTGVTPVKSGQTAQPDLSQRNREDNFGLKFTGYINVPADGQYTFYTYSDDGSKLYIGTTEVVNNDFGHAEQERSGTIGLKAGRHAISIPYLQGGGGKALSVSYSGPGIGKQVIPAASFYRVGSSTPPPPPPVATLRDPENPANAVVGLDYSYYEGVWGQLPDFNSLTPIKVGQTSQADLSPRNRDSNYGLRFQGYVAVPADGQYTFYTNSDDGSKLYIGTTQVVDNDGGHAEQERSGTIGLKAGKHAITIPYVQGAGGQALSVSFSGPGVNKQVIPASAFYRVGINTPPPPPPVATLRDPENPVNATNGLDYSYYEGSWGQVSELTGVTPVKSGQTGQPDLSQRNREDNFGLKFTGYINVPADGQYTFYTYSDDGSKLYIGTTEVVNNDFGHAEQERSGTIGLKAGRHAISIPYLQGGGGKALSVSYSGPGIGKQVIPASAFYRVGTGTTPTTPATGLGTGLLGSYFNNKTLTAPSVLTRTDPTIDFDWGLGSPAPSVNVDNFSVRWSGQVEAPVTGSYFFTTTADDGVRLWVNNVLVIDNWNDHPPTSNTSGGLALVGGQKYSIRLEYYESGVGALARLQWSYGGQGQQLVPQSRLYPASSARLAAPEVSYQPEPVVYPVPAQDKLHVRYYSATGGQVVLQLVSVGALPVFQSTYDVTPGENLITLPVRTLMRDVYLLNGVEGTKRFTSKVLLTD
ncbi:right-handed parallel beta-helix repeat-containing protein [Fibrella sp. HMF5335]|uniref:Right-handed parallel beta-helix repeat-containing protein n=1 Tax=Fibrella rubiginis TaxID=2817060 RepID=A0A939K5N8_9BACT|nr:PA14 domain-containing protein [Fibrella rubiginis]MBO0939684.1 right-handed parallel beta-helix repeat-containing protein [Fibrella rubiginis]